MKTSVLRLEQLLAERVALIEKYASLWAVHGGGSSTWEDHLVEVETAALRERVRKRIEDEGKKLSAKDFDAKLYSEPEYRARVTQAVEGRTEWVRVREAWNTVEWRIQLEMAKLRLDLGDEATPASLTIEYSDEQVDL